jgi:hypothetical protein
MIGIFWSAPPWTEEGKKIRGERRDREIKQKKVQ